MAERNWQDYDDLGEAPAAGDFLLIRDVSDTTDSADGTVKEITVGELRSAIAPILTADIPDGTVTFAKIQDASGASRLLGRGDGGAGDFQEIVLGAGLSMTGTTLSAAGAGLPADDTTALVQDPVDNTKRGRIDVGGVATATTRAIVMGDRDVNLASGGTFAELSHTHAAADIASGTLADARVAASNVTQHQAALSIATSQITGDLPLAQIADIASPTVLANVSGGSAAPSAVSSAAFKAGFGFGALGDKNFITVSDISAGGTPSTTTFLRGDGSWAPVVASVNYDVTTLGNATTLTAAHQRYQIVSGNLQTLKLLLRHSTVQADPVRITLPDTEAVAPSGVEFDLIQADDQTGLCVIRPETNGSINGRSFAANAVASSAWTNASGAEVDISDLPSGATAEGDIFEVRNHSTAANNGFYRNNAGGATCTKLSGANPANAAAEAVDIDTGWTALAGTRATAVLIVDENSEGAPNARLEGETNETRSLFGRTEFAHSLVASGGLDVNGTSDFSQPVTLSGTAAIIGGGSVVSDIELKDIAETYFDAGNKSGAASFDYTNGGWQKCVATANISSVAITNAPASGRAGCITLEIHQDGTGNRTIAWGGVFRFPGGTDFTLSTAANAIDIFTLITRDGGTTWYNFEGGKAFAA